MILVVSAAADDTEREFGRGVGLESLQVVEAELSQMGIRRLPSLAVVDGEGTILLFREGVLTEESKREVLALIAS